MLGSDSWYDLLSVRLTFRCVRVKIRSCYLNDLLIRKRGDIADGELNKSLYFAYLNV